ncbi:MAG TPA: EamA family transporter [Bellilinea sp.]
MSLSSWAKFWYMGLVWGATFLWLKVGIREMPPISLNAVRLVAAMLALFIILRLTKTKLRFRECWRSYFFLGVFNIALPFVLITISEHNITSGMASILNSTVPFFTMILIPFFVPEEAWTLPKMIGLVVGFAGVVILAYHPVDGGSGFQWGALLVLLASVSYAVAAIFARRVTYGVEPAALAFGQSIFANLVLWPTALLFEGSIQLPVQTMTWVSILWLGIMATAIGTFFFYSLINTVGATRTTLTTYIFPLVGVLLGVLILNEALSWRLLAGGALIIAGVAIVNSKIRLVLKPQKASRL